MSGAALAELLTAERADGRATTPATVSRWVQGHVRPAPGVMLFLKRLLIDRAKRLPPPVGRMRIITIGGAKGGAGATPMCAFLAAAARSIGYRVRLGATSGGEAALMEWSRDLSIRESLETVDLCALGQLRRRLGEHHDLLIVDVGSRSMLGENIIARLDLHEIDLAVIPFVPLGLDIQPAIDVARSMLGHYWKRFMLQPHVERSGVNVLLTDSGVSKTLRTEELKPFVSEAAIFRRYQVEPPRVWWSTRSSAFQDADLEAEYGAVLSQILLRLGIDTSHIDVCAPDYEKMDVGTLLRLLRR